jgi:hypothetical protein
MTRALAGIVDAMSDVSDAFEEAVRCRAAGIGLVPIGVIRLLTLAEWYRIRTMGQPEARRLVAIHDAEPLVTIDPPRKDADHER